MGFFFGVRGWVFGAVRLGAAAAPPPSGVGVGLIRSILPLER